jgi:diguanylate cyclase (GGDEF)-like protein
VGTGQVQVTASIGVCGTQLENKKTAQEILDGADRAMYKSKQSGRNRVTTWASMAAS